MHKIIYCLIFCISFICCTGFSGNYSNTAMNDLSVVKDKLEKDLTPMVPEGAGGMVGLFKPGEEPQYVMLGVTSVQGGKRVNKDTLTLVASTSKMFAGLLSIRLVELNILSLDTELSQVMDKKYFEIFKNKKQAQHITLRQVLSHTSGLQYDADCENNDRGGLDLNLILNTMARTAKNNPSLKIQFTNYPKDRIFSYSNNIWIAAIFIESAYNQYLKSRDGMNHHLSYADILNREILKPLNMARTGFEKSTDDPFTKDNNRLQPYVEEQRDKAAYSYEYTSFDPLHRPVGGLWTTSADLMKLAAAFGPGGLMSKTGKVLISKSYITQLIQPQGINGNVGLGVYNEHGRVGKGGCLSSYGSNFEIDFTTGNAVASSINFRPSVPVKFDARAILALDDMGSIPRPGISLNEKSKNKLRLQRTALAEFGMDKYNDIYFSKFGYIGVMPVSDGLIMNWNGYTLAAEKIAPKRFMIFDDANRDGTVIMFGNGPDSHKSYLFFENGNDNSQAFKMTTKSEAIPEGIPEAIKLIDNIHGSNGRIYKGIRPDGVGSLTIRVDKQLGKVIVQCEGKEVPVIITKIIKNSDGQINEIWLMGNHFIVPDKLTKIINKDGRWVVAIAIFDNPDKNVEYLTPNS